VKHIVMFLAEQKYQELHIFAVMLLTNCVEDAEIVKVIVFIILIFMLSPTNGVGEGIMFSGCPFVAFVRPFTWKD